MMDVHVIAAVFYIWFVFIAAAGLASAEVPVSRISPHQDIVIAVRDNWTPQSPGQPLARRAFELIEAGKLSEAKAMANKAIIADPKWPGGYVGRGIVENRLGNYEAAQSDLNKALEINPKNPNALVSRASARRALGDLGGALADLDKASSINPSGPGIYAFRALVYLDMGDDKRALKEAKAATQLGPQSYISFGSLGLVYLSQRQFENAVEVLDKSLQLYAANVGLLTGRAVAHFNLGDYDHALTDLNAALKLNPNFVNALGWRGRVHLAKREYRAAIADLTAARGRQPKQVVILLLLAKANELIGELQEARSIYAEVLGLFPGHGVAQAGLQRVDEKMRTAEGDLTQVRSRTSDRAALVIGNTRYGAIGRLKNTENDARLIASTLQRLGFEKVEMLIDASRVDLLNALTTFSSIAATSNWAVIYYAGHGIEYDGNNYLVPVDAKFREDADIPKESVALDQVLNAVRSADKLRLVVLDACRDNPLIGGMKRLSSQSIGRGLARIEPEAGTLVAFATKHGHTASDGPGDDSPFALSLAQRMQTPGVEVSQVFRLVHDDVVAATKDEQEPFTYGQLPAQQFYFKVQW